VREIAALLDLRGMRQADYRASIRAAATCAVGTDRGEPIARAVIEDLKERRITLRPGAEITHADGRDLALPEETVAHPVTRPLSVNNRIAALRCVRSCCACAIWA